MNRWVAVVLGLFAPPMAMLYAARWRFALVYFVALVALAISGYVFLLRTAPLVFVLLYAVYSLTAAVHAYYLARNWPAGSVRPKYSRWYGLLLVYLVYVVSMGSFRAFLFEPFHIPASSMLPTLVRGTHIFVQKWGYGHYSTFDLMLYRTEISAELRRGDILVFDYPENPSIQYVKRLIALPGDRISYLNKKLSLNGVEVPVKDAGSYEYADTRSNGEAVNLRRVEETLDGQTYSVVLDDRIARGSAGMGLFPRAENCSIEAAGLSCTVPEGHYFMLGDNRDNSRDSRYWGFVPAENVVGKVSFISH